VERVNIPSTGSFVEIIQAVHQGGYFGVAALILLIFLVKGVKKVPREFTLIAVAMLILGAVPLIYTKDSSPSIQECPLHKIAVTVEPSNITQIATALQYTGSFPSPKLYLPSRRLCSGPDVVDSSCPVLGTEFEMTSDHEILRVSMTDAFDELHKRINNLQSVVRVTSAQGVSGSGVEQ
jgi:hypothetical protein